MSIRLDRNSDAVFAVDVQKGFMPGDEPGYGELPAPDGAAVAAPLAELAGHVNLVLASGDAHTPDHSSFAAQGGAWPVHCVAGTPGAELHPLVAEVLTPGWFFAKGTTRDTDAYSGFQGTDLAVRLRAAGIERLLIGGLVTNVCVRATALEALQAGFEVIVVTDACRAITADGVPSAEQTFTELRERGAVLASSAELA
jgi:nicotinamidase/pyrazinamidase